jgi:hypothetical protein
VLGFGVWTDRDIRLDFGRGYGFYGWFYIGEASLFKTFTADIALEIPLFT